MSIFAKRVFAVREMVRLIGARPLPFAITVAFSAIGFLWLLFAWTSAATFAAASAQLTPGFEASVFLAQGSARDEVEALKSQLQARPDITRVDWHSREAALEVLTRRNGASYLAQLKNNPLPDVLVVKFASSSAWSTIQSEVAAISNMKRVDSVAGDLEWHQHLAALNVALRLFVAVAGGLAISLFAIGLFSAIGLQSGPSRQEAQLFQMIGADAAFAARPYGYLTGIAVLVGSAIGAGIGVALAEAAAAHFFLVPATSVIFSAPLFAGLAGWAAGNLLARLRV